MEFYFAKMLWLYLQIPVSIPNGMEFYQKAQAKRSEAERSAFQFPTGWNSTDIFANFKIIIRVSIPNGMEFYLRPFA